jgi:hypothetical protein
MGSGGDRAAGEPVIGMMDRREALLLVDRLKRRTRDPEAFLLLVTWLAYDQPPSHYQVPFNSNEACEAARQQLIKDAERIRQAKIDSATAAACAPLSWLVVSAGGDGDAIRLIQRAR